MRGFLIRAVLEDASDETSIRSKQIPVVGIVVRTNCIGTSCYPDILPVIHEPNWADEPGGGLRIFDPKDEDTFLAFATVWCWWSPDEDQIRLHEIHEHVVCGGKNALVRQKRRKA